MPEDIEAPEEARASAEDDAPSVPLSHGGERRTNEVEVVGGGRPAAESPTIERSPETATEVRTADDLAKHLEETVQSGFSSVLQTFERKLAYDATKQQQIDRLHAELERHRSDLVAKTARPLVTGMIQLYGDIGKLIENLRRKPPDELTPERFFGALGGVQEDIEIVLAQNGVSSYREEGSEFNPRRQSVVQRVTTSDESLANKVAHSVRPGFDQGGNTFEKERVAVYAFAPASSAVSAQGVESESAAPVSSKQE